MRAGSIVNLVVRKTDVNYTSVFSAPELSSSTATGFVVDVMEVIAAPLTWVGEVEPKQFTEADRKEWVTKLKNLGVSETADGKFLVIVTNAHVVHGHKAISFKIENDPLLYTGVSSLVLFQEVDLAVLIPSVNALPGLVPLTISTERLHQNDKVLTSGFPKNGTQLSVTQGCFKRFLHTTSAHSGMQMVAYETDTSSNNGDSGAPVFNTSSEVVAVHFQHMTEATGQSHCIPIQYLIVCLRNFVSFGRDLGVLSMPIFFQSLQNEIERGYYGLDVNSRAGVLVSVRGIYHLPDVHPGDVLLSVNGFQIDGSGNIDLYGDGKMLAPFKAYLNFLSPFENVRFKVLRNRVEEVVDVALTTPTRAMLTVSTLKPTDWVAAFYRCGIAFAEPSSTKDEKNKHYKSLGLGLVCMGKDQKGVVYGRFMSSKAEGYPDSLFVIARINDTVIRDLFHAYQVMKSIVAKRSEDDPATQIFRVYSRLDVLIPTYVVPVFTGEQEEAHRRMFHVEERFADLPSPSARNPIIKKFWDEVRDEAHRVSLPVRQQRFNARCFVNRAMISVGFYSEKLAPIAATADPSPVVVFPVP